MSLMDVETSAEALQEEEELIEAVETFVETAAVSIWSEIVNEIESNWNKTVAFAEILFPVLKDYQRDESLFWADMEKLLLSALLFVIAFFLLAPRSTSANSSKRRKKKWMFGAHCRIDSKETIQVTSPTSVSSPLHLTSGTDTAFSVLRPAGSPVSAATLCMGRVLLDDETDEVERFEKLWINISKTAYRRLVLPPQCKFADKPKRPVAPKKKEEENKKKQNDLENDEDHPARRLQMYCRQVFFFIKSLLSFDYVSAGWTLLQWFQACLRSRKNKQQEVDEEEDDDTSRASTSTANTATRRTSHSNNQPQQRPQSATTTLTNSSARVKFDTNGILPKIPLSDHDHEDQDVDEEKKDEKPLFPIRRRSNSEPLETSVYYDTRGEDDGDDDLGEADVGERLVTLSQKLNSGHHRRHQEQQHIHPLTPPLQSNRRAPGLKRKDALETYRAAPINGQSPLPLVVTSGTRVSGSSPLVSNNMWPSDPPPPPPLPPPPDRSLSSQSQPKHDESARYFFETANSPSSLRRMNVEVPVPDRNGYILGDEFLPDSRYTPLLVFVNSRSGPQQGQLLITQLRRLINPIQIWDLADGGPTKVLESFCVFSRLRILVCGGDGTVSWIISELEKMKLKRWPPIAILPLGTGNDLARIHGWGGGYNNESLIGILEQVAESYISMLDRWEMTIESKKGKKRSTTAKSFINYLGVGADAQAALQVHMLRESRPKLFFSRVVNKAWYGVFGAEDIIKASSVNIPHEITLIADGIEIPLPHDSQGIILLNIDSYAGGVPLWSHGTKPGLPSVPSLDNRRHHERNRMHANGEIVPRRISSLGEMRSTARVRAESIERVDSLTDLQTAALTVEEKWARVTACEMPSSCQDGLLDVVSIRGAFHLGQIKVGLSNAQRLCQCREATIIVKKKVAVQIDGEPWRQDVSTMRVARKKDAAVMLHRSPDESGGVETEMAKLLDWAEERQLIDSQVHAALMKEFSRRIENKTRQRRVRSQDNLVTSLKRAIGSSGGIGNSYPSAYSGGIAF